jgi:hypothetical protein
VLGDIDLSLCAVDRRAGIEHVPVDEDYRRNAFGRLLVVAALSSAPSYRSTTTVTSDEARAFWAAVAPPAQVGGPAWCPHMRLAASKTP